MSKITVRIHKKFGEVEELWNQFFDIVWVFHQTLPHGRNRVKLSVCHIKSTVEQKKNNIISKKSKQYNRLMM